MKSNIIFVTLSLAFSAAFASSASAVDAAKPATAGKPEADQILRQMSARIGHARQFTFEAQRRIDPTLIPGGNVPANARIEVSVLRPNKIMSKSTSQGDARNFYEDGRNLTEFDATKNLYATVPMHTSIDGMVGQIEQKYGFTLPLTELALSDIYQDIRRQAQSVSYLGRGTSSTGFLGFNSAECDRVAISGKVVDAELWVAVSDQLPRKLVFTFKNRTGRPQVTFDFSNWNLAAQLTDRDFVFAPPAGAMKIPMMTTAQIEADMKKARGKGN